MTDACLPAWRVGLVMCWVSMSSTLGNSAPSRHFLRSRKRHAFPNLIHYADAFPAAVHRLAGCWLPRVCMAVPVGSEVELHVPRAQSFETVLLLSDHEAGAGSRPGLEDCKSPCSQMLISHCYFCLQTPSSLALVKLYVILKQDERSKIAGSGVCGKH